MSTSNEEELAEEILQDVKVGEDTVTKVIQQIQIYRAAGYSDEEIQDIIPRVISIDEQVTSKQEGDESFRGILVTDLPEEYQRDDWQ